MRRQTKPQPLADRWSARAVDIDPYILPKTYVLDHREPAVPGIVGSDRITIGRRSIAVQTCFFFSKSRVERKQISEFSGVVLRVQSAGEDDAGEDDKDFMYTVFLLHPDPKFQIPLYRADHSYDIAARWMSWSKVLRLPALVESAAGQIYEPFDRLGKLIVHEPVARSPQLQLRGRRPLILRYREVGSVSNLNKVSGREIIARK